MWRKEEGRGLATIEDVVDSWIQVFGDNIKKIKERLFLKGNYSIGKKSKYKRQQKQRNIDGKKNNYV